MRSGLGAVLSAPQKESTGNARSELQSFVTKSQGTEYIVQLGISLYGKRRSQDDLEQAHIAVTEV